MRRILVGSLCVTTCFVISIPLVFWRSGAFGLEAESGVSTYLQTKWSVVGSISSNPKPTSQKSFSSHLQGMGGGIAILMDRKTSKTYAVKFGELIPGTDLYRISHIGEQEIRVTDGSSQFTITHQGEEHSGSALWEEEKFSPLSALEAYYQNLSEPSDSSGESYQDFIRRIENDPDELEGNYDLKNPQREDRSLTITKKTSDEIFSFESPSLEPLNQLDEKELEQEVSISNQNREILDKGRWVSQSAPTAIEPLEIKSLRAEMFDTGVKREEQGEKNKSSFHPLEQPPKPLFGGKPYGGTNGQHDLSGGEEASSIDHHESEPFFSDDLGGPLGSY